MISSVLFCLIVKLKASSAFLNPFYHDDISSYDQQFNYSFYEKFPENMINVLLNRNSKNIFVKFWIWNSKNSPEFRWPI